MSLLRRYQVKNGYRYNWLNVFKCDLCGKEISESIPHETYGIHHYCGDCAFRNGFICEHEYLKLYVPIYLDNLHVGVNLNGEIEIWQGKLTKPWERNDRQQRNSPEMCKWRVKVFKRDNYTCADCKTRGGALNAHHIKSFKEYPKLRFMVSNGVTLCQTCHKKRHSRK